MWNYYELLWKITDKNWDDRFQHVFSAFMFPADKRTEKLWGYVSIRLAMGIMNDHGEG
jgi:hypothetical protein